MVPRATCVTVDAWRMAELGRLARVDPGRGDQDAAGSSLTTTGSSDDKVERERARVVLTRTARVGVARTTQFRPAAFAA